MLLPSSLHFKVRCFVFQKYQCSFLCSIFLDLLVLYFLNMFYDYNCSKYDANFLSLTYSSFQLTVFIQRSYQIAAEDRQSITLAYFPFHVSLQGREKSRKTEQKVEHRNSLEMQRGIY